MKDWVKSYLEYDKDSGLFRWKKRDSARFDSRFAGKVAGSKDKDGYMRVAVDGKYFQLHRLAWFFVYGYEPKEIDHINRIKDDNRIENLRDVTRRENMSNLGVRRDNSTGFKGVGWCKHAKKYRARCIIDGKRKTIGYADTAEEASKLIKG